MKLDDARVETISAKELKEGDSVIFLSSVEGEYRIRVIYDIKQANEPFTLVLVFGSGSLKVTVDENKKVKVYRPPKKIVANWVLA